MAKNNESKKLVKGMAKELQYIMDVENLLCTFLSLDNEEKLNELLGKIKNKKGADAWFNKVIKNTAHLIGDDNFKEEFETYVNTNRASLTDIIVNYDSSVTEEVLKAFLNNTEVKSEKKDKEVVNVNKQDKLKVRTTGDELGRLLPKKLYNKLPKAILECPIEGDATFTEEMIKSMKPVVDLYMDTADLNKLEKLSKEIDSENLKFTPGQNVAKILSAKGFESIVEGDAPEVKSVITEDDIRLIEIIVESEVGMDVIKDIVKVVTMVGSADEDVNISEEEIDEEIAEIKNVYIKLIEELRTKELNDGKDFKIKVLDREIEVKGSKWNHEILSNAKEAIVEEFELFGSGIAMFDHSMDLVLDAIESNKGKWSDECYMTVFDKILDTERKPFTLKVVKRLAIK